MSYTNFAVKYPRTYWNNKGQYQKAYELLYKFLQIPFEGNAPTADGNKLRKLSNQYYQFYNNGVGKLGPEELERRCDELIKHLAAKYIVELQSFKPVEEQTHG